MKLRPGVDMDDFLCYCSLGVVAPLLVYVSGPYEDVSVHAVERNARNLSLVCRRILRCGHIPVCPTLMTAGWEGDPSFAKKDAVWWVENVNAAFMAICDVFCYLRREGERVEAERRLWRKTSGGDEVPADMIMDYLLRKNAEAILDDE